MISDMEAHARLLKCTRPQEMLRHEFQHGSIRDLHKGGWQDRHRVSSVDQAQGGAHQGMEGPLERLVANSRAAKSNTPDVSLRVLQRSPCRTCIHVQSNDGDNHRVVMETPAQ